MGTSKDLKNYPKNFWDIPQKLLKGGSIYVKGLAYGEAVGMRVMISSWRKLINEEQEQEEGGGRGGIFNVEELIALNAARCKIKPEDFMQPRGRCTLIIEHMDRIPAARALDEALGTESGVETGGPSLPFNLLLPEESPSAVDSAIDDYLFGGKKEKEDKDSKK